MGSYEMRGSGLRTSSGRPQFMLIGLLLLLFVVCFKYWNLTTINYDLQENLKLLEQRLIKSDNERQVLTEEKSSLKAELDSVRSNLKDKNDENAELMRRIKSMTDEIDAGKNSLDDKTKELSQCQEEAAGLKSKLNEKLADVERLEHDVANQIGKLKNEGVALAADKKAEDVPSKIISPSVEIPRREDAENARRLWARSDATSDQSLHPRYNFRMFSGMLKFGSPILIDPPDSLKPRPRFSVVNVPKSAAELRDLMNGP